jgi:ankyrin repeat protein
MISRNLTTLLLGVLIQFHGCTNVSWGQSSNGDAQRKTARYTEDDVIQSVRNRDTAKMEFLISAGVSPNAKETTGETALNIAAGSDNVDAVVILLRKGAQVNLKGYLERSPLFHSRSASIAKLLLDAGANLNARDALGQTPLMYAPFEVSKLLIDLGADVNLVDKDGFSALSVTAEYGEKEKVDLLLLNGADVNARAQNGWTALIASGGRSSADVAETLLQHGADPNAKMDDGLTALMRAATWNSPQTAKVLLKFGADPNAKMDDGTTALSLALKSNNRYGSHSQIIELLRKTTPLRR